MSGDAQLASQGVSSSTKRRTDSNELDRAVDHACELGSCCLGDDVDERRQRDLVMPGAPGRGQRLSRHELGASPVSRLNARLKASSES